MEILELEGYADQMIKISKQYEQARCISAENKISLDYILATRLSDLREKKSNAGIDTLYLMLIEDIGQEASEYYKQWKTNEAKYKGLERILEALQEKINVGKIIIRSDGGLQ